MQLPSTKLLLIACAICGAILITVIIFVVSGGHSSGGYSYSSTPSSYHSSGPSSYSDSSSPPESNSSSGGGSASSSLVLLEGGSAVPLLPKSAPYCHALAPEDWSVEGSPTGNTMELFNPDHTMYVAWAVSAVDRGAQQYFGDLWADPETAMLSMVNSLMLPNLGDSSSAQYITDSEQMGDWRMRSFASAQHTGMFIYHLYGLPPATSPGSYTLSARTLILDWSVWDRDRGLALGVVSSIGCITQLVPSYSGSGSRAGSRHERDESDDLRDYNVQLGTQWAHSPSTGENFLVDRSSQYNENGPDGPGYYRKAGNSYEKLDMGWSD